MATKSNVKTKTITPPPRKKSVAKPTDFITWETIDYTREKTAFFKPERLKIIETALKNGHTRQRACALAQVPVVELDKWLLFEDVRIMIEWAEALFSDELQTIIKNNSKENTTTAIKFLSEVKKELKDSKPSYGEAEDELIDILQSLTEGSGNG